MPQLKPADQKRFVWLERADLFEEGLVRVARCPNCFSNEQSWTWCFSQLFSGLMTSKSSNSPMLLVERKYCWVTPFNVVWVWINLHLLLNWRKVSQIQIWCTWAFVCQGHHNKHNLLFTFYVDATVIKKRKKYTGRLRWLLYQDLLTLCLVILCSGLAIKGRGHYKDTALETNRGVCLYVKLLTVNRKVSKCTCYTQLTENIIVETLHDSHTLLIHCWSNQNKVVPDVAGSTFLANGGQILTAV